MENIPLRAYNREIEHLIDNNRSQDALRHCQQILDIYPRCLETFRLMGKAYLELQQYEQAEETFQKVLSSLPDDFTANLGMSLLCEKQNNLAGTIWHMERAYETQPSNTAVQSELRRLYQQRDGVASSRIRLTRGALVRMYIKGDLIPQALNETQAILNEDPSRIDIGILQASALLKAGKKDEALQYCRLILQELPYCYEANRILFENTPASTRIEEAQNYQQRLRELDPYYEFTSSGNSDPLKVPEDEVKIEIPDELSLQKTVGPRETGRLLTAFETFAKIPSVGAMGINGIENKKVEFEQKNSPEEEKPAWLEGIEIASLQPETKSTQQEILSESLSTSGKEFESSEPMTTEEPSPNAKLPVRKEAPSDQPSESSVPANPFLASTGYQIPVAEPGDIPEWLRALASEPPAASSDAITAPLRVPGETGVLQTGEENLDFLRNLPGEPQVASTIPPEKLLEKRQNLAAESLPGILPTDPFLVTNETTQPVPLEEGKEKTATPSRDMPGWLKSAAESTVEPAFLGQELAAETPQEPEKESPFSVDKYQLSTEQQSSAQPESEAEEIPTPELEQYLEQLRKDVSPGEQPEWLQRENLGSEIEALFDKDKKPAVQPPASEQSPSWMADLKKEELELPQVLPTTPPVSVPNVPDWLFTSESNEEDTAPIQLEPPVTNQPTPDWLKEVQQTKQAAGEESTARPDIFGLSDSLESSEFGKGKSGETEDQEQDLRFLQSQPIDFLQSDREPLEDNLDSSKAIPAESLPADLAALLRDETEKEVHTNPLQEEESVSQTFTPSDFFTSSEFLPEQILDATQPDIEIPVPQEELPVITELQPDREITIESIEPEHVPSVEMAQVKETGPVFPAEEIQPREPVATFEEVQPVAQVAAVEEIKPFKTEEIPSVEAAKEKPDAQFIPEEQPAIHPVAEKKHPVQFVPEEKPAAPTPIKVVRAPEPHKPSHRIEKPKPVAQPIPRSGAGAADLARAREAVARGDLIAALRRYIKLVNANKSLDHVSSDLKDLVRKNPKNYLAWQTYGDARLRSNRIQEALDAYAKAADLLK
jgi:tetratricopeptide (TPR) repeat protein